MPRHVRVQKPAAGAGMQAVQSEASVLDSGYAHPDFHLLQSARQLPRHIRHLIIICAVSPVNIQSVTHQQYHHRGRSRIGAVTGTVCPRAPPVNHSSYPDHPSPLPHPSRPEPLWCRMSSSSAPRKSSTETDFSAGLMFKKRRPSLTSARPSTPHSAVPTPPPRARSRSRTPPPRHYIVCPCLPR